MGRLQGKVALITGAGTGIGRAGALLFASEGAHVVVTDVDPRGESVVAEILASGGNALFVQLDVTDPDSVAAAFATVDAHYGRLDVLYNNAGGSSPRDNKVTEVANEEFWRTIKVDLFGTWLCCKAAIPLMARGGGGSIVNTTSSAALRGIKNSDAYTAAKGGVLALSQSMAVNYAADGIRVNVLAPSGIRTERVIKRLEAMNYVPDKKGGGHLLGLGEPRDIASAALFLACDDSAYVTGITLPVDGGWYAVGPSS
jgi:NAD(P)-dependent dehydrogenase (short-subunit alcohol dehydrogenase family)